MSYFVDTVPTIGAPGEIHTTQKNQLGLVARANDGNLYKYLKGTGSTANTDFVVFDEAGQTARFANTSIGRPAVATAAANATSFAWYGYVGSFPAAAHTAVTDNSKVYASDGAGQCNSTAVTGQQVVGAVWRSTATANVAVVQLNEGAFVGVADAVT